MGDQPAMRVMILVPGFPLERDKIRGGVHSAVLNLLLGFEHCPVKIRLLSIDPEISESKLVKWAENIEVQYCAIRKLPNKMLSYLLFGSSLLNSQIAEFRPDILHYQIGGNFLLTKLWISHRIPALLTIHGIAYEEARVSKSLKRKINMYWNGTITKFLRPKNIINISHYSKNLVAIRNNQRHPIIYNAVSSRFFSIPSKHQMTNKILFVGVIKEGKNLRLLLEALNLLKLDGIFYQLSVVGGAEPDSVYLKEQHAFAEEHLKGQVEFLGWRTQSELSELLAQHDIMALPSRQETLPMSVAEAMAAGKVVMVSRVGGTGEMVKSGVTGYLLESEDVSGWVDAFKEMYNNTEALLRLGNEARSFATANFECSQIAARTLAYYQEIIEKETRKQ